MPLANDLRPESLDDIVGQDHILAEGKIIREMARKDAVQSMILWGPAGTGKTTIARCLANDTACTSAKVAEVRKIIDTAHKKLKLGTKTILFIDEIHRFSKSQQDVLLPSVEDGTLILVGATTEKPMFSVNNALLSRMQTFEVMPVDDKGMMKTLLKAIKHYAQNDRKLSIDKNVAKVMIRRCSGDARKIITVIETIVEVLLEDGRIEQEHLDIAMPDKHLFFDAHGNEHYLYANQWQDAIQNSDANSAIYWLAKWIASGEDPSFICRRILISAAEDAPLNPHAMTSAMAACYTVERCGLPEGRIPMALATIEIANSPRNKIADRAIAMALDDVLNGADVYVPAGHRPGEKKHGGDYTKIDKEYVTGWIDRPISD